MPAHKRNENVRNADRTVGKLQLLDKSGENSRRCKPRTVERVNESRLARFLISESRVVSSRLIVVGVGRFLSAALFISAKSFKNAAIARLTAVSTFKKEVETKIAGIVEENSGEKLRMISPEADKAFAITAVAL